MDKEEEKQRGEAGGHKRLSTEQPKVSAEMENKLKHSNQENNKFKLGDTKGTPSGSEYASDSSESSEVIRKEFKDMYGVGEEYEEMEEMEEEGEEEGEEEETSEEEEEDLSEFKLQLEEKYMKGVEFNEEYLKNENKKIEDVPLQLYAIETYINSVRTFYGFDNHWIRLKIFDSPCFEIQACTKVNMQASMYANRSLNQSKGSVFQSELPTFSKMEVVQTEVLSQKRKNMQNKRLDYDLSKMSKREKQITIDRLMHGEVTSGGTDYFTKSKLKVQSIEKEVGLDIPITDLLDDEEVDGNAINERRGSKTWILREPIENGKTIMFPMRPAQFIHQLQRQPLMLFVLSTSGMISSGNLELSGLTEAVIRASKGPPYPISSMQRFKSITTGDFTAKVVGTVRVIAIGPEHVATIKSEDAINDQERPTARKRKPPVTVYNMDSQEDKPPILTGPQKFTLYDIVQNIRTRKQREKYMPQPRPAPKRYYVDDLVFNRAKNTVTRSPKKTYQSLRAEIDRYLVLNKSRKYRPPKMTDEEIEVEPEEDERSSMDEEGEEEQEMEMEDERHEGEETPQRVEAVFQSLLQAYGQNWANYKGQASPQSSSSVVHERLPMKRDDSSNSLSSSSILETVSKYNKERRKH